jgi:2-polyprenyl-3-methyl-5-hydroxy-6-metoxy-1,4-benzoquinol methylase
VAGVKEHYDNFLASHYSWICGGSDVKFNENRKFFQEHGVRPVRSGIAVDLGAGPGFQSIPLAESGFNVIAIDTSRELLAELTENAKGLPIAAIQDNLLNFAEHSPANVNVIVCMGDTLTHLRSLEEVQRLLKNVYAALEEDGLFILSFRDLTVELKELDRFIPVRNDAKNIFMCFLEYEKKYVKVHDIIYKKTDNRWQMNRSFFRKLRISAQWTKECLCQANFKVEMYDIRNAMVTIIARK